jgi:hypothetical protein
MQRNKRSVKQWLADHWQVWWRRNTTDPDPAIARSFRLLFGMFTVGTLWFTVLASAEYTDRRASGYACIAALYCGVAVLTGAVLQERRRTIP